MLIYRIRIFVYSCKRFLCYSINRFFAPFSTILPPRFVCTLAFCRKAWYTQTCKNSTNERRCNYVRSGAPIVTLGSTGLAFNAISRKLLGYPENIDIGYDEAANAIGICAHRDECTEKPYEFETRQKDGWVRISCRDFMRYLAKKNHLDFTKAKQFIPEYDPSTEMLIVIVDEDHQKPQKTIDSE